MKDDDFIKLYTNFVNRSSESGATVVPASSDAMRDRILEYAAAKGVKPLLICVRAEDADKAALKPGSKIISCEWCGGDMWCHRWYLEGVVKVCLQCADEQQTLGHGKA